MPYIDPETILQAKRMDLLTYLKNYEPDELVLFSQGTYCTRTHDSLKISNGKWYWWSRNIGGKSALDYLVKVQGLSFLAAVERITSCSGGILPVSIPAPELPKNKKPKQILLPERNPSPQKLIDYLQSRGIDDSLIHYCLDEGLVYQGRYVHEPTNMEFANAVFLGFDENKKTRYASIRGIDGKFRGEATDSDKRYSFAFVAATPSTDVHLFESAIDLLSFATMLIASGKDFRAFHLLSLAGVYQPQKEIEQSKLPLALTHFLEQHPEVKRVVFRLDKDHAGWLATKAIRTVLPKTYETEVRMPHLGKDYNEWLCMKLGILEKTSLQRTERANR